MNPEQARFNMIEQQIRPWDVLDPVVLNLLKQVPREDFVPARYAGLAFADLEIPLGHGEHMLSPKLEARIVQALALKKTDRVLEIGTGSGYLTALLARLAKHVTSVEMIAEFSHQAAQRLAANGTTNVTLETGDAAAGWGDQRFDVIVLGGSMPLPPTNWQQQLAAGGRLFAVVGEAPVMEATLTHCLDEQKFRSETLFETCIPPLVNVRQPQRFSF